MTSKVAIFVADGTEPLEALAPIDALRRGGVDAQLVSTMGPEVVFAHGVVAKADKIITEVDLDSYDMLVVPGGSVGVENLGACQPVKDALVRALGAGHKVASICAGPMILADLGLLKGRKATCYPGCEGGFPEGSYVAGPTVVVDNNLITASGPGVALDFGIAMLRALEGDEVADSVASGMLVQ